MGCSALGLAQLGATRRVRSGTGDGDRGDPDATVEDAPERAGVDRRERGAIGGAEQSLAPQAVDEPGHEGVAGADGVDHLDLLRRDVEPIPAGLTPAEAELLDLVAEGLDNRAIAERLGKSVKTVRNQLSMIFSKLGVHNRSQAIVMALSG